MTIVLKLGGSVITDKSQPEAIDESALHTAASTIASTDESVILTHGGGSFGHHYASKYSVSQHEGTRDITAIDEIHESMKDLNSAVLRSLRAQNIPAVPVHPFSWGYRQQNGDLILPLKHIEIQCQEGFVPVLHGDVITTEENGVTILSGDEIVVEIANQLLVDRIGLCSSVPGVLRDGSVIPEITSFEEIESFVAGSESADVTGGMAGKVQTLLTLDVPATIFGLSDLSAFLEGNDVGTTINPK
ncbi:MAG: isopentenyl phosphate kinase [Halobacteriaceae archaeon]